MANGTSVTSRLTTTRSGAIALGVLFMIIALILLLVYVNRYRNSVEEDAAPAPVLVAKSLIPKGTSGTIVAQQGLYTTSTVPQDELKVGAITDPAYLQDRVATADIYPGQQMTTAEFAATTTDLVQTQIVGAQRAIDVPIGGPRHLVGVVQSGDRIDIYTNAGGVLKLVVPNVFVLRAPAAGGAEMIFRAKNSEQAATLALLSDATQTWYILRPTSGAKKSPPTEVTLDEILRKNPSG